MSHPTNNNPGKSQHTNDRARSNKQEVQNLQREQSSQQQFQNRDHHDRVNTDRDHSNKNFSNRGNTDRDTSNDRFSHQGVSSRLGDHPKEHKAADALHSGVRPVGVTGDEITLRGNPNADNTVEDPHNPGFSSAQDRAREASEKDDKLEGKIRPHMPVVCSNGKAFATVDHVEGRSLKLTREANGQHHYIPLSWVLEVDDSVHIDRPGPEAMAQWSTSPDVMADDSARAPSQPNRH